MSDTKRTDGDRWGECTHRVTSAGFKYLNGSASRSIGYEDEMSPTLISGSLIAVLIYENSDY